MPRFALVASALMLSMPSSGQADDAAGDLRRAVTLYASFDEAVRADFGGGELTLRTRMNDEAVEGKFVFQDGFDGNAFRIAPGKGRHGGALECVDVLPRNGRIFFPARGNLAYDPGGWGGALSFWINTDPNRSLKTRFCDPVQITHRGAGNGAIWVDFNDAQPRDLRMGVFPAVPEGGQGIAESDPNAPLVRVPAVEFRAGDWHHVVVNWRNFDTGRPDAEAALTIDGQPLGEVADRPVAMEWDLDSVGIYVAVNFIGLLDEFALFDRPLAGEEIELLRSEPGVLAGLKGR